MVLLVRMTAAPVSDELESAKYLSNREKSDNLCHYNTGVDELLVVHAPHVVHHRFGAGGVHAGRIVPEHGPWVSKRMESGLHVGLDGCDVTGVTKSASVGMLGRQLMSRLTVGSFSVLERRVCPSREQHESSRW